MNLEHIIAFNFALCVALISPGPAFVIAIQTTLSSGQKSGMWFGAGLGLMAAAWTGMALVGLEAVFHLFPWAYGTIRIVGALYLLYIAIKIWLGSGRALEESQIHRQGHSFVRGVMINALNPKSIFFAAAVLAIVFPPNMRLVENVIVVFNQFVVESMFYAILAYVINRERIRSNYIKFRKYIDRTAAIVLGGFGLSLVVDRYSSS